MKKNTILSLTLLFSFFNAYSQSESCLLWGDGIPIDGVAVPSDTDYNWGNHTATITYTLPSNAGTFGFFYADRYEDIEHFLAERTTTQGGDTGFLGMGFDNNANDPSEMIDVTITFFPAVYGLRTALLDIDGNDTPTAWDDGVNVFVNDVLVRDYDIVTSGEDPTDQTISPADVISNPYYQLPSSPKTIFLDNEPSPHHGFEANDVGCSGTDTCGNVELDFSDIAVSSIRIQYFSTDDAAQNPNDQYIGIGDLCFDSYSLSGNLFHDADGLVDMTVDGTGVGIAGGVQLYATLLDPSGKVIASVPLNADGSYSFDGLSIGSYEVQISTTDETVNRATAPSTGPSLPSGWANTGEGVGAANAGDGTVDGKTSVTIIDSDIVNVDFGIEQPPTASDVTAASQANPGGTTEVQVPALNVSDPEDIIPTTITITTIPDATTEGLLYYNGNLVTAGQVITNFDPALLTIDPIDGAVTVDFTYTTTDAAGIESAVATVTMPFSIALPIELISLNVYKLNRDDNILKWKTGSEINNSHFDIEYSTNSIDFTKIGSINGKGNSNNVSDYSFIHKNAPSSILTYYRLNQIDFDGTETKSDIVSIKNNSTLDDNISIFPNPISSGKTLNIRAREIKQISIINQDGLIVLERNNLKTASSSIQLDLSSLQKGVYYVKVDDKMEVLFIY